MSNVVFACTAPSMAFFQILSVYCALGFGLGRFCVSKRALRARCTGSSYFRPITRAGFRFLQVYTARGDFKFFQVFAPLCGPLRGDFRGFPAGVILSRFAHTSGLPRPLRGYAPHSRKSGLQMRCFIAWVQDIRDILVYPCRCGASPPTRHAFRVPLGTGGGNFFQLYESF